MVRFALALALALLAACDPCLSAFRVHQQRCVAGDQASCEWEVEVAHSGQQTCPVEN